MFFCETVILGMCLTGASVDYVNISEYQDIETAPITVRKETLDGENIVGITLEKQDISDMYKSTEPSVAVGGSLTFDYNTKISVGYGNGYASEKYNVSDTYSLAIDRVWELDENLYLSTGYTYTQVGDVYESSCLDERNAEHNCRTGGFIANSPTATKNNDNEHDYRLTLTWKF